METFAPGDRVVAINTDMSGPIYAMPNADFHPFSFPDGNLRREVIYHIAAVRPGPDGHQAVFITGLRVLWGGLEVPFHPSRFRKVDTLSTHAPEKRRRKRPVAAPLLTC